MRQLSNRVAVVTGAASGIGRATAQALSAKGCALAIADVDEDGLAETARSIEARGGTVTRHHVDVAERARMQAFADEVIEAHGRAHIIVNNAGVTVTAKFEDHSLDDFEWLVGINFWGVVYGCKFFLPHLRAEGWGSIVNLSSVFGLTGVPSQSSYCATKFAVRGLSESLAYELANDNIDVLCVHPGGIRTNIVRNARGQTGDERHARMVKVFDRMPTTPERAAELIVAAIERRRQRLLITPEAKVADVFKRLLPVTPLRLVAMAMDRSKLV